MKFFGYICSCYKLKNVKFDDADVNKDGKMSLNEFHQYFVDRYGVPPTNDQWMKFHLADINNNGYITKFEVEMFQKRMEVFD